jgi:hypothetical protein
LTAARPAVIKLIGYLTHRFYPMAPDRLSSPFAAFAAWLERCRAFWEQSFDRLDDYLRELQSKEKPRDRKPRKD